MRRRVSILICVFLLFITIGANFITVEAANITQKEKSYEIAVVFDNSGSMYDNESWSRAKYAMEVFAAMLNEGDVLKIYPMHPVTTDGKTKSGALQTRRFLLCRKKERVRTGFHKRAGRGSRNRDRGRRRAAGES